MKSPFSLSIDRSALNYIYASWLTYMVSHQLWGLFHEYWEASITMILGSFVAGATAEGGGAIAFPVFTKVLHIPADEARTFSLMIQSIGMTTASILIFARRIPILPQVIIWVTLGGVIGQLLGSFWLVMPPPFPKVLFTFVTAVFGAALIISHWFMRWSPVSNLPVWNQQQRMLFVLIGILGGTFAAQTGVGIDMLTFIVLTLAFGVNEKISTPTTVIIMGLNSVVGFFIHGLVLQDISTDNWNYWLVSVPIVILGAPLGAYVASRVQRDSIIKFLLFIISVELVTTFWLIPLYRIDILTVIGITILACIACFWLMMNYRSREQQLISCASNR